MDGKNSGVGQRIKLMKDLKFGKVHLRQSLLEVDQIWDLSKIFKAKKQNYLIGDQDVTLATEKTEQNEEQIQILMSPFERIEVYRKEKLNKKMKEKMNKMLDHSEPARRKSRMPKTTKMLESFQDKYKKEMPISYKEDLRESEINLNQIKMNGKRKFQTRQDKRPPLYHSRMQRTEINSSTHMETESSAQRHRKRFMSLKTSLPEREKFFYPSIREIIQGKVSDDHHKPVINLKNIDVMLESFLNKNFKKMKVKNEEEKDKRYALSRQNTNKPITDNSFARNRKEKLNVERSFTRSEESSKQVISTMTDFYEVKHEKKEVYDEMVENLKYDRPLTSSLRRKNYTVLGKDTLNPIEEYREFSQAERIKMRKQNFQFYMSLIEGLEKYHEEDIPTTIFIIEEVRKIFQFEYTFNEVILKNLIGTVEKMEVDARSESILHKIGDFVGYKIEVSVLDS